jgi:hypothetical protein
LQKEADEDLEQEKQIEEAEGKCGTIQGQNTKGSDLMKEEPVNHAKNIEIEFEKRCR